MTQTNDYGLNGLIVKHHDTLRHLITFTLEERRLFDFCIQHYDSRKGPEKNTRELQLPVSEFKKAYPQHAKYRPVDFFTLLINAAIGINQKPYKPNPKEAIFWFTKLKLVDEDTKAPIFKIALTEEIMPFFLGLIDHYISYHRAETIQFNKPLSYTLFEYIQEIFQSGQCPKWRIDLISLKDRLGATNKYKRVTDFILNNIDRPLSEINEHTRLSVEYDKLKKGRTITGIQFRVIQKALDPDVIDTEDLGKIFARELALAKIAAPVAVRFVKAAADRNLTPAMLEKLPKIKKSWGKNGGKSYSAYLSGVLRKELLEMDLFETSEKGKKAMNALQTMPDATLQALANTGNIPAQKILGERKNKNENG